ncbi:RNA 2',3'-cyclic phosphodiesterase [Bacillus sp. Bva_UNVM-123]|uniref:RNA 2',3'-cyclic phosphodiesterase n=1 Tax=Bacillus sp. Bva_UNVM-123 TaxID=2829798 RepID=UPI00391F4E7D
MEKRTHFFFAVSLPNETKRDLNESCRELKAKLPFNRWVYHEDYHITLAFLGSASSEKLMTAKKLVQSALKGEKSFSLHINQLGVFGKEDEPRIFWADTIQENRLSSIRDKVYSACVQAGFELDTRAFKPHITLARKWSGNHPFHETLLKINHPFDKHPLSFEASEVVLYETHLDQLPKYEKIAIFPLLTE